MGRTTAGEQDRILEAIRKLDLGQRQEQKAMLSTIHENQAYFEQYAEVMQQRIGALQDTVKMSVAALENLFTKCDMSQASEKDHQDLFDFNVLEEYPPMVEDTDDRISNLVQRLQHFRKLPISNRRDEAECRSKAIIPFFEDVARVVGATTQVPDADKYSLKVNIAGNSFAGKTDLVLCREGELPILGVEMKPMLGDYCLKYLSFNNEKFKHKAQVVLQCVAFQSICSNSTQFSCILTNLKGMYVVQIQSYNATQISAQIFKCVTEEREFVKALLKALDSNSSIPKLESSLGHPISIFTASNWNSSGLHHTFGGIHQAALGTSAAMPTGAVHGAGRRQHADGDTCEKTNKRDDLCGTKALRKTEYWEFCFAKFLPSERHQKSDAKPNFIQAWLHMLTLSDCSNHTKISRNVITSGEFRSFISWPNVCYVCGCLHSHVLYAAGLTQMSWSLWF